jgi:hypothetical protein
MAALSRPQATVGNLFTSVQACAIGSIERCEVAAPLFREASHDEADRLGGSVQPFDR